MLLFVYVLLFIVPNVSTNTSSFCLCALKNVLEEYALFTTDLIPPRYHSLFKNDIGFYVKTSSNWIPVNDATWMKLSSMINAPSGMYTYISIDGIDPVNDGLNLNDLRSSHLADIIASYRSIIKYVTDYHEKVIKSRSQICNIKQEERLASGKFSDNKWQKFFLHR